MGTADRVIARLGSFGLVGLAAGTLWAWPQLPDLVPIHFGFRGQPDGWGPPYLLLLLPGIGLAMYWVLTFVAWHPDLYAHANTTAATHDGKVRQYALCRQLVLAVRAFIAFLFLADLILATLVATGKLHGLGAWLMPAELASLSILVGSYITAALRAR